MSLGNTITIKNQQQLDEFFKNAQEALNKDKILEFKREPDSRTKQQNNSMHQYFRMVAKALSDAGIDTAAFFKPGYTLPFTEHIVKSGMWLPLMKALTKKEHTSKLDKKEVSVIYEYLNGKLAEHGIHVPFPSNDSLMNSQR